MKSLIYKDWGIRAMLAGKKPMTRRLMNPQPPEGATFWSMGQNLDTKVFGALFNYGNLTKFIKCPFSIGDIFYAKEAWQYYQSGIGIAYRATADDCRYKITGNKWRSPLHLREQDARIFRQMTNIKAQQLQNISEEDAIKEGVMTISSDSTLPYFAFQECIIDIHGPEVWDKNLWVWGYEYTEVERSCGGH